MIALLGGSLAGDQLISDSLHASLALLLKHQSASGSIPNNVDSQSLRPNFRAYADGGLWWIIGSSILAPDSRACDSILRWYECQDVDQTGLLSMQESTDWQDLFCTRGKGLYLNCLYALALKRAGRPAQTVRDRINQYHWYRGDGDMRRHISHTFSTESPEAQDSLGRKRYLPPKRILPHESYYLAYLGFRAVGEWFDSLGHLLAIVADVADTKQANTILDFIERYKLADQPMRALYPPVQPGDLDWRDYYGMLNVPHQYHNGGIWPFIGGFYVAVLVKCGRLKDARAALERLAQLNAAGQFNEWHHGESGDAMGVEDQAWSSGMYIYAYHCVERENLPYFG